MHKALVLSVAAHVAAIVFAGTPQPPAPERPARALQVRLGGPAAAPVPVMSGPAATPPVAPATPIATPAPAIDPAPQGAVKTPPRPAAPTAATIVAQASVIVVDPVEAAAEALIGSTPHDLPSMVAEVAPAAAPAAGVRRGRSIFGPGRRPALTAPEAWVGVMQAAQVGRARLVAEETVRFTPADSSASPRVAHVRSSGGSGIRPDACADPDADVVEPALPSDGDRFAEPPAVATRTIETFPAAH